MPKSTVTLVVSPSPVDDGTDERPVIDVQAQDCGERSLIETTAAAAAAELVVVVNVAAGKANTAGNSHPDHTDADDAHDFHSYVLAVAVVGHTDTGNVHYLDSNETASLLKGD